MCECTEEPPARSLTSRKRNQGRSTVAGQRSVSADSACSSSSAMLAPNQDTIAIGQHELHTLVSAHGVGAIATKSA